MTDDKPSTHRAALRRASERFWAWRAGQQPRSGDDIPRIGRPPGWTPDWSAEAVASHRRTLGRFETLSRSLRHSAAPVPDQIDQRLLESAVARVRWELDVVRAWQRDPAFYIDQSIGVIFDLLLRPPPIAAARADAVLAQLAAIPRVLAQGATDLGEHRCADLTRIAAADLPGAGEQLRRAMDALLPFLPAAYRAQLPAPAEAAARAIDGYARHLRAAPQAQPAPCVGERAFRWYLNRVACLPFTPEELIAIGRRELARTDLGERLERLRNRDRSGPAACQNETEQIARHRVDEQQVRAFLNERGLLTLPEGLRRYLAAPMPPYLAPIAWLGVTDDLTGPDRLADDAVTYLPAPDAEPSYFDRLNTLDPRLGIIHEGAHHHQLAMSWAHPNPVRRHFYDSAANEGIAFYNEELLLRAGLLDDNPAAREAVHDMQRLRAARVEADVGLAVGTLTVDDAAALLRTRGGLGESEARREAVFFRVTPGQGMSYQIGKTQVTDLAARAVAMSPADDGALRRFHDHLWRNGNVPLSLVRWEYFGLPDQVPPLDDARLSR